MTQVRRGARLSVLVMAVVLPLVASLLITAPSAAAHTRAQAIEFGCGSGYQHVSDGTRAVTTSSGTVYGYVHLAYNSSNGYNCVVTRKTSFHGTGSRVTAVIYVGSTSNRYSNSDTSAGHWESIKRYARGTCVGYYGHIWSPGGTQASGGRTSMGNCG